MGLPFATGDTMTSAELHASETPSAQNYRGLVTRRIAILGGLTVALVLSVAVDVSLGPARYAVWDVLQTIFAPGAADLQMRVVVWDIRMPMALLAVTVGASLSLARAQMQTILANPLASPFTLGLSAAASFGAALAMVLGVALFHGADGADQRLCHGDGRVDADLRPIDVAGGDDGNHYSAGHRARIFF